MGMDVYGKAPTSEAGEYFRNNLWWWRPLAEFVTHTYPELTSKCQYWHTNDGDGLNAQDSAALAQALTRDLDNGTVDTYAAERAEAVALLPMQECWLCEGTGARTDDIGREYGYDKPGGRPPSTPSTSRTYASSPPSSPPVEASRSGDLADGGCRV